MPMRRENIPLPQATTTASRISPKNSDQSCDGCVQLLLSALQRSTRASQLLSAMGAKLSIDDRSNVSITITPPSPSPSLRRPMEDRGHLLHRNTNISAVAMEAQRKGREQQQEFERRNTSLAGLPTFPIATSARQSPPPPAQPPMEIQCSWCGDEGPEGSARAFVKGPDPMSITLCANRLQSLEEVEEVLVHELIHVYDVRVRKGSDALDLRQCDQLAYSEVRAAREAECFNSSRFTKAYCVRDRAAVATSNMFPKDGRHCVAQVYEEAMKDLSPFNNSDRDVGKKTSIHYPPHSEK